VVIVWECVALVKAVAIVPKDIDAALLLPVTVALCEFVVSAGVECVCALRPCVWAGMSSNAPVTVKSGCCSDPELESPSVAVVEVVAIFINRLKPLPPEGSKAPVLEPLALFSQFVLLVAATLGVPLVFAAVPWVCG
jgi:hypothetical protein